MKLKKIYQLFGWTLLLGSCQSTVILNTGNTTPLLVLNSILEGDCDSLRVQLSLTQPINDTNVFTWITDAGIQIFENGEKIADAEPDASGWYVAFHKVKPNATYRIEAETAEYGKVWGETHVPDVISNGRLDIDSIEAHKGRYKISYSWTDHPEERNFYWLGMMNSKQNSIRMYLTYLYTDSPLPDPFNRFFDDSFRIPYGYEHYIRIDDLGLSGKELHLIAYDYSGNYGNMRKAFLLSVDSNYDAYIKSTLININNNFITDDIFLFYEPAYTHSNIHGGVGLVASCTHIEKILITPEPYEEPYPVLTDIANNRP